MGSAALFAIASCENSKLDEEPIEKYIVLAAKVCYYMTIFLYVCGLVNVRKR